MRLALLPSLVLSTVACGGTVVFEQDGDGGGASTSQVVVVSAGTSTDDVAVAASGVTTVGTGGASVTSSNGASTGQGGSGGCASLNVYTDCLAAAGQCVPVFDDLCCSSCFPGGCADCVDFRFVGCTDRELSQPRGICGEAPCGFVPDWACEGERPACDEGCFGEPGCVEKQRCSANTCKITCDAVRPDACGDALCNAPPPVCFDGTVPEVADSCWTGLCIPEWVCATMPPL